MNHQHTYHHNQPHQTDIIDLVTPPSSPPPTPPLPLTVPFASSATDLVPPLPSHQTRAPLVVKLLSNSHDELPLSIKREPTPSDVPPSLPPPSHHSPFRLSLPPLESPSQHVSDRGTRPSHLTLSPPLLSAPFFSPRTSTVPLSSTPSQSLTRNASSASDSHSSRATASNNSRPSRTRRSRSRSRSPSPSHSRSRSRSARNRTRSRSPRSRSGSGFHHHRPFRSQHHSSSSSNLQRPVDHRQSSLRRRSSSSNKRSFDRMQNSYDYDYRDDYDDDYDVDGAPSYDRDARMSDYFFMGEEDVLRDSPATVQNPPRRYSGSYTPARGNIVDQMRRRLSSEKSRKRRKKGNHQGR